MIHTKNTFKNTKAIFIPSTHIFQPPQKKNYTKHINMYH